MWHFCARNLQYYEANAILGAFKSLIVSQLLYEKYLMLLRKLIVPALTGLLFFGAATANAATVTYSNAHTTPQMQLVIDDGVALGAFRFSLTTTVGTADFLALGFNYSGAAISSGDITLLSATRADDSAISPTLGLFGNNTGNESDCGHGCNFNGSESATYFDYIIRIGDNGGGPNNYVKSVVFDITVPGSLAGNPFSQLAVRAQSTSNPSNSIKADLTTTVVPLPAGFPLLISGLLGLGYLRQRRRKS